MGVFRLAVEGRAGMRTRSERVFSEGGRPSEKGSDVEREQAQRSAAGLDKRARRNSGGG